MPRAPAASGRTAPSASRCSAARTSSRIRTARSWRRRTSRSTSPSRILLLHYLLTADGTPPAGAWSAYRELPDGLFYAASFAQRAEEPLARAFAASAEGLDAFRAAARAAGGDALTLGDASFRFAALPRVDVAVLVWAGDDEEPGRPACCSTPARATTSRPRTSPASAASSRHRLVAAARG